MTGIISFGAYVPLWRMDRSAIAGGLKGEKALAGFDEDSITMAVAAAVDCLHGIDRSEVDGLFFAGTTIPYKEKLAAATVAAAADLRRDVITADFANSLRAGTMALRAAIDAVKAGSAKRVLVVAADCRLGAPGSSWESGCGDGAACFLVGTSEDVIAEVNSSYSVCDDILDVWRNEGDRFVRSAEGRFVATEGYARNCREAVEGLMKESGLSKDDFTKAVFGIPESRAQSALAKGLGFDVKTELQDSMSFQVGDTGAANSFMLLAAALEEAKADDRFLWVSYGNGCDAMSVTVTGKTLQNSNSRGVKGHLEPKKVISDYKTYARWKGLLPVERPPRPLGLAAPPALWREHEQNVRLYGVKCKACGSTQYPPQNICTKCHAKDRFEKIRLSDKKGKLFTYSVDYLTWSPEMPSITSIVDFEGGGRMQCLMADTGKDELSVAMPLEMSFRKLDFREGINVYSWKSVPVR